MKILWTLVYLTFIYRKNVVYCTETGSDQSGSSPESQPSSTTPPANPGTQSTPASCTTGTSSTDTKSADKKAVTLDIKNNKDSTSEFDHNKSGSVATYTAKGDNAFNVVKHNQTTIWSTKKKDEYADKVVLNGRGKKEKKITIHLPNNKIKVYNRPGKNKGWVEDTNPPKPTSDATSATPKANLQELQADKHPKNIKLYTADATDTTKTQELENTKYKVKQDSSKTDIYVYELNDGSNCSLVKCDDKEVWKHDATKYSGKYPKSINYNKKDSVFLVTIDGKILQCKKENDNWNCVEANLTRTVVDLTYDTKSCNTFDYKDESGTTTFTVKSGYGFYFVKDNGNEIWRTNDSSQYASKVEVTSGSPKSLTISCFNGSTKKYKKSGGLTWTEDTSASGTQPTSDGSTPANGTTGTGGTNNASGTGQTTPT